MTHKRASIRQAIVDQIGTGTPAGARVFARRVTPMWKVPLPAILVYARSEDSERLADQSGAKLSRTLHVSIEARLRLSDKLDDELDLLAAAIEGRMGSDESLGGLAAASTLVSTEIDFDSQGEDPLGAIRLTYEVVYHD